jgi:signal peptidase
MFYVERGENWYNRADPDALGGADSCAELANCPAPHGGFVTKGDANDNYDQVHPTRSTVVRPEWVIGTAELRVPELGWLRL